MKEGKNGERKKIPCMKTVREGSCETIMKGVDAVWRAFPPSPFACSPPRDDEQEETRRIMQGMMSVDVQKALCWPIGEFLYRWLI